ncbi:cell surface glycoprotein 1 isoform X7 [Hylaeus anthracinus]|uniref:cell surface glycoprotein 1 isoform X7 n=1 Tax=Hylaeus anthracinus TaxID=313031 RepID=UPI0023B93D95|nr:cell surface glycoprotein 1 isoform X7 [Hylaeus anthracinus]
MPANKGNLSTPHKEKPGNGLTNAAAKKKKRCTVKHKKHCKQYLQLHSEYRSTYTWHEYTGPHQEHTVVRRAPQPPPTSTTQASAKLQSAKSTEDENNEGPTLEPPLPRRKKCPELAYKTHEFITAADGGGIDTVDSNVVADKVREVTAQSGLPPSQLSKAISRISTEYRLQFAWPRRPQLTNGETVPPGVTAAGAPAGTTGPPRKSLSMGALKQGIAPTGPAPVHKKRPGDVDHKRDGVQASELEPLVGGTGTDTIDGAVPEGDEREEDLPDLKIAFRSVTKEEKEKENTRKVAPIAMTMTMPPAGRPSSVQARPMHGLLQDDAKADTERAIARARKDFLIRHHLDRTTGVDDDDFFATGDGALLPSPTREKLEPVIPRRREDTKEHKEEIQPKTKSSPKNSPRTGRSQSLGPCVTERRSPKRQPPRAPSVTKDAREKEKEPKDKEKELREKSGEPERHPRPITGPGRVRWSIREPSTISSTGPSTSVPPLPPPPSGPGPTPFHRRPPQVHRKSFLATTAPPHRPLHHAKPSTTTTTTTTTSTTVKPPVKHSVHTSVHHPPTSSAAAAARPDRVKDISRCQGPNEAQPKTARDDPAAAAAAAAAADPSKSSSDSRYASNQAANAVQSMTAEPQINGDATGGDSSIASTPPSQTQPPVSATAVSPWIDDEPVVKSPPEPTRVKSPEQMIMRSPEPVNWTVPLDTGKTFTVTQNVREEPLTRPHSEAKTWAPSSLPSAPQSAPPELAAQHKSQHSQHSGYKSPESESVSIGSFTGLNGHKDMDSERDSPLPTSAQGVGTPTQGEKESGGAEEESKDQPRPESSIKPVAGTNLRCLEDPGFEYERKEAGQPTTTATMTTPSSSTAPQPGYRILEADLPQGGGGGGGGGVGGVAGSSGGSYHVLEAPTVVPGTAQRSAASEALEKARNRFDKFWGKGSGSEN